MFEQSSKNNGQKQTKFLKYQFPSGLRKRLRTLPFTGNGPQEGNQSLTNRKILYGLFIT